MSLRKVRDALIVMVGFCALIWLLQIVNWADSYRLDPSFGIWPHNVGRIEDIFTAPFLHFNWQHIEGNTVPLFVLGFLSAYRGIRKFLMVTLIVLVTSGLTVWLFQSTGDLTVGASGIIFGYFGYVLVRGVFDRNLIDVGIGIAAGLAYWTILAVAIPGTPGISWLGHLGGLVGGVLAGWVLRARPEQAPLPGSLAAPLHGPSSPSGSAAGAGDHLAAFRRELDDLGL
jgi:membrane associated rhomboid family serine protease